MLGRGVPPPQRKSTCAAVKSRNTVGTFNRQSAVAGSQLGRCTHTKPSSRWQLDEQPSPSRVLPSSQPSLITSPSPQSLRQLPWLQSGSAWQSLEQPSSGTT